MAKLRLKTAFGPNLSYGAEVDVGKGKTFTNEEAARIVASGQGEWVGKPPAKAKPEEASVEPEETR